MSVFQVKAIGLPPQVIDEAEVRRALGLFLDPAHGTQLQELPSGYFRQLPASDIEGLINAVRELGNGRGTYWLLNPMPVGNLGEGAKAHHILHRRWLLVDIDRKQTDNDKDQSSTEEEKEHCREVAQAIQTYLFDYDWPAPVIVDSGNGWHLLYRIDLPNDEMSRSLIKGALYHVAEKFDSERITIDRKVHNANRISKLPGTWARKGTATKARPHRPCKLIHVPKELEIVTLEQLESLTRPMPTVCEETPMPGLFKLKAGGLRHDNKQKYVQTAIDRECGKIALSRPGTRNEQLNTSAFSLGTLLGAGLVERQILEEVLTVAAYKCGLNMDSGCGERGIANTIKSGLDAGMKTPRIIPEFTLNGHTTKPLPMPVEPGKLIIIRASEIKPKKIRWLWPGRIPLGKLTTFAGQGGLGKTFVLCDITARVTRGLDWPDSGGECCEQGQVLFVSGEDDPDDTLVPRLIEMGADLNRVIFLTTEIQDRFTLADLPTLDEAMRQAGGNVRFIAIDPPTAYLGGVDDHKNAELRSLLSPMKNWASENEVAMVFNTHVNKGGGQKFEAMMRVMGSVAWVNAVRAAHMFSKDADDPARRLFIPMKMNVGKERKGLAYQLAECGDLARVQWLGEVDTTADEAMSSSPSRSRKEVAAEWLLEKFRERQEWHSDDLFKAGKEENISRSAIWEAKAKLDVPKPKRNIDANGNAYFVWRVDEDWLSQFEDSQREEEP